MPIFFKGARLQEMERKVGELEAERIETRKKIQELIVDNILSINEVTKTYTGNSYKDYKTAVQAISNKYCGKEDWGCTQTGTIIDLRAAFILGEGVQVVPTTATKAEAELEMLWTRDFFTYNGLDAEMAQEIAKEVEIEGKVALNIIYDNEPFKTWPGMVSTRFIPWTAKKYVIEADPTDYLWYKKIHWDATGKISAGNFPEEEFVYKKFGGRIFDPNDAQPKIMKCLTHIDRFDMALWDLRQINHLFAAPIPIIELEADAGVDVAKLQDKLDKVNWKVSKGFVLRGGVFSYKSPDPAGIQNLISEIELCIKVISGVTGIPIHYLGLLDLLKNRATGENTRELVMAATAREREIWIGAFTELIEKAMRLYNVKSGLQQRSRKLEPTNVRVEIPEITQEHWDRLEKVLIPAALGGIISKEYVASQIPGIDMEAEEEKKKQKAVKEAEEAKEEMARLKEEAKFAGRQEVPIA